jgi:hypothetical protein
MGWVVAASRSRAPTARSAASSVLPTAGMTRRGSAPPPFAYGLTRASSSAGDVEALTRMRGHWKRRQRGWAAPSTVVNAAR